MEIYRKKYNKYKFLYLNAGGSNVSEIDKLNNNKLDNIKLYNNNVEILGTKQHKYNKLISALKYAHAVQSYESRNEFNILLNYDNKFKFENIDEVNNEIDSLIKNNLSKNITHLSLTSRFGYEKDQNDIFPDIEFSNLICLEMDHAIGLGNKFIKGLTKLKYLKINKIDDDGDIETIKKMVTKNLIGFYVHYSIDYIHVFKFLLKCPNLKIFNIFDHELDDEPSDKDDKFILKLKEKGVTITNDDDDDFMNRYKDITSNIIYNIKNKEYITELYKIIKYHNETYKNKIILPEYMHDLIIRENIYQNEFIIYNDFLKNFKETYKNPDGMVIKIHQTLEKILRNIKQTF